MYFKLAYKKKTVSQEIKSNKNAENLTQFWEVDILAID